MEIQEMSFWELALEAIDAERRINDVAEQLEEMQRESDPLFDAFNRQIAAGIESGEIEPGRYQWGNDFLYLHENGTFSVQPAPRGRSVFDLPGYREWSDGVKSRKTEENAEG